MIEMVIIEQLRMRRYLLEEKIRVAQEKKNRLDAKIARMESHQPTDDGLDSGE